VLEQCAAVEVKARDQLQPLWVQFGPHDKAVCISEASMDGAPSYVELMICLEMARDANKASK
jgi:hypothetical protein